eukprot:gb/GFBE01036136.1/.p1 GENE.gb/GFBE01036136.1/~~gb/GFBE01036136.1/.p1  ORF type:complete len:126 (+),score=10.62 gb/GFBE01036136.1/:1-378(+)
MYAEASSYRPLLVTALGELASGYDIKMTVDAIVQRDSSKPLLLQAIAKADDDDRCPAPSAANAEDLPHFNRRSSSLGPPPRFPQGGGWKPPVPATSALTQAMQAAAYRGTCARAADPASLPRGRS